MKFYIDLSKIPTQQQFQEWSGMLQNLKYAFQQVKVSLSKEERSSRRKMGARHSAYAQTAEQGGTQYEQIMPRHFTPYQFTQLMLFFDSLRRLHAQHQEVFEMMDDTLMAVGIDAMTFTKIVHDAIRSANYTDPSYDSILRELDEFNKRAQAEEIAEDL
jgi:hypothetical protein